MIPDQEGGFVEERIGLVSEERRTGMPVVGLRRERGTGSATFCTRNGA